MAETETPPTQLETVAPAIDEAETRTRYAQMVDAIRSGATPSELHQACTALRPLFQAIAARV